MYVSLNYDFIFKRDLLKTGRKNFQELPKRKYSLKRKIITAADRCSHFLENMSVTENHESVSYYSAKKFKKLMKREGHNIPVDRTCDQMILNLFDEMFYNNEDTKLKNECISQLDGQEDTISAGAVPSCLYAVKCEEPNVKHWIHFFRSFYF